MKIYLVRKKYLNQIEKTQTFIQNEIHRKSGNFKQLHAFEIWEYEPVIRNHPLSVDLDLCTKQGLFPYLDTTVSIQAWNLFQERILQIQSVDAFKLQEEIRATLQSKSLTYQLLRKSLLLDQETKEKVSIHGSQTHPDFWQSRKILKYVFKIIGVFTPTWLIGTWLFPLPFATLILLVNLLLFLSYRKESAKLWIQIQAYSTSIEIFENVWKRMAPSHRKSISKMAKKMHSLGNSFAWVETPIAHYTLNILFLWDLWKIDAFLTWESHYHRLWQELRDRWILLEASLPIAQFAYLHPDYAFPSWNADLSFQGTEISHPLLNENIRISNELPKTKAGNLMIVTGSNMSGKTTYLRAIAVNLLLAGVGGPVCGKQFSLSKFKIHTLIRSQDSLENGISFFYSEVRRLAEIIRNTSSANELSILFLDEILKGTNSKERQIATREILHALKEKGAIVFLTTHDLEIAEIPGANLYHFTELEKDGEMFFDFKMRQGISRTTNALKILKKEGIPIRETGEQI